MSFDVFKEILPGTMTNIGGSTFQDDLWNPLAAFEGDGVNNSLDEGSPLLLSGAGSKQTLTCWVKAPDMTATTNNYVMTQISAGGADSSFIFFIRGGAGLHGFITCNFWSNGSDILESNADNNRVDVDVFTHIGVTVDGSINDLNLFVNGVEETYSTQDVVFGSGYSGPPASPANFTIGAEEGGGTEIVSGALITRPKIWFSEALSPTAMLAEYNSELAAIFNRNPIISKIYPDTVIPGNGVLDRDLYHST